MRLITFLATVKWSPLQSVVLAAVAVIIIIAIIAFRFNYRIQMRSAIYIDTQCDVFNAKGLAKYLTIRRKRFKKPSLVIIDFRNLLIITKYYENPEECIYLISDLLLRKLGKIETLGRIEYNKFCIVYDEKEKEDIKALCKEIEERINQSDLLKHDVDFILKFGVYLNADLSDPFLCIKNALYTLSYSKDVDDNIYFYSDDVSAILDKEKKISEQMHSALEQNKFVSYIQPKVSLETKRVCGGEILVRWVDDSLNPIFFPNEFIPLFETNGFVKEIDMKMFENACMLAKTMVEKGHNDLVISVNLSKANLEEKGFINKIDSIIDRVGVSPKNLEIEITETTIMNSYGYVSKCIMDLRQRGFKVAMDDFGKEYSSLGSLSDNPFDTIKLDGIFFKDNLSTDKTRLIVEELLTMLTKLNYEVVCEGVENKETLSVIGRITRNVVIQGYYFSRPVPTHQFESFVNTNYDDMIDIPSEPVSKQQQKPAVVETNDTIKEVSNFDKLDNDMIASLQLQIKEMKQTIEDQKKSAYEQELRYMREQIEMLKTQGTQPKEETELERLRRELAEAKKKDSERKKALAEAKEIEMLKKELAELNKELEKSEEDIQTESEQEVIEAEEVKEEKIEEASPVDEPVDALEQETSDSNELNNETNEEIVDDSNLNEKEEVLEAVEEKPLESQEDEKTETETNDLNKEETTTEEVEKPKKKTSKTKKEE